MLRSAVLLAVFACINAGADDSATARIQQRLQATSADEVNAYLDTDAGWKRDALPFFAQVKQCNQTALKLMLSLTKTTTASAAKGNTDLLELAMGKCPELLLPMVPLPSVPQLCTVEAWAEHKTKLATLTEQIAEIDRRVIALSRLIPVASSEEGKSCVGSYAAKREQLGRLQ